MVKTNKESLLGGLKAQVTHTPEEVKKEEKVEAATETADIKAEVEIDKIFAVEKEEKIANTFNLDKKVAKEIEKLAKKYKTNKSDVVNKVLKEVFKI